MEDTKQTKSTVVHCKKEPYDIYIGRGSIWGNPFTHKPLNSTKAKVQVESREEAILEFEKWLLNSDDKEAQLMRENLYQLKGKVLGCWCAPKACHGDVLAKLANQTK